MFIDRLNEALKKNNLTGNKLCQIMDMPNANYTNWKKQTPRGETLKKIADILNVSVDWLLERENAPEPEETELIDMYRSTDQIGKDTIISAARFQAARAARDARKNLDPFA